MDWTAFGFYASIGAGIVYIAVMGYLWNKEEKRFKRIVQDMRNIGTTRYELGKEYTEKEKGYADSTPEYTYNPSTRELRREN